MQNRLLFAALLAATPILALSPVAFPETDDTRCVRATAGARRVQRQFMSLMRRRDEESDRLLQAHAVPHVRSGEVRQVSDPDLCAKAATAYGRALRDRTSRKVHILHIGGRFVVVDPEFVPDSRFRVMTFDSTFSQPLALVAE